MQSFLEFFQHLFKSDYLPHGHCYFWEPGLVWLHVISDGLIALAYYSIPVTLYFIIGKRVGFKLRGLILMFAAFILACGTTHLLSAWNIWHAAYRVEGVVKAITAALSVATAIVMVKLAPVVSKLATPEQTDNMRESLSASEKKVLHLLESERLSSETRLHSYFESASQAILVVSHGGLLVLVNHRTEEMFGYTRLELLGQPLEMLIPSRFRHRHEGHRHDFFGDPRVRSMGASGMKLVGRRKDGTEFPVEIGLSFVEGPEGIQALGLVSDLSEHKRVADEMARVNEELRRSNSDLEQFAYVASHDLQEPLRMISSYLSLLERRYGSTLDSDAREFIHFAVDGAARMKGLIQDLLSFSRAGRNSLKRRKVEGQQVLDHALKNLQPAIDEAHAEITADPLPAIAVDPSLLTHVFQNLIGNGIKFHGDATPHVHIAVQPSGEEWIFSVRDNGIGIETQYNDRIFRIFERLHTSDRYPGSGVGLAISKKIVERHGGRMWLESQPGKGSTFYFSIPKEVQSDEISAGMAALSS